MVGKANSSLLKRLRGIAESEIAVSVRSKETQKGFPMLFSCCCDIREAKDMSVTRHCAEGRHF